MKELKENIQKNNMKKLVLSAILGMFCYCANNAMKKEIEIDSVLKTMLKGQINISNAKNKIEKHKNKIYSTIKDEYGKVKKRKLLTFIENQLTQKGGTLKKVMKIIEKYFHLEGQKEDYECTEDNLTEIFWAVNQDENGKIDNVEEEINQYFAAIHNAESSIGDAFKEYYAMKKIQKPEAQDKDILKEIMEDCCGEGQGDDSVTKFIGNLRKMEFEGIGKEAREPALAIIEKRITLSKEKDPREKDFISFLKQKIGEEVKKEEKTKEQLEDIQLVEEEGCLCCNC